MGPLKILVYEFFSAGESKATSGNLTAEGLFMLAAAVKDLGAVPGVKVVTVLNRHYQSLELDGVDLELGPAQVIWSECGADTGGWLRVDDSWPFFRQGLKASDAALVIAPETGGILAQLTELAEGWGKIVLGSSAQAVAVAGDKKATLERLAEAGIAVPKGRVYGPEDDISWEDWCRHFPGAAVVKPVDGAGSQATFLVRDQLGLDRALKRLAQASPHTRFLIQEYIPGEAASVSCLVAHGPKPEVLTFSLNQQLLAVDKGAFCFQGVKVPYHHPQARKALAVASRCCQAIPGLAGFVGVDLVLSPAGPVVMEVNPRLTDAYVALRQVTGTNLGQYLLEACIRHRLLPPPDLVGEFTFWVGGGGAELGTRVKAGSASEVGKASEVKPGESHLRGRHWWGQYQGLLGRDGSRPGSKG